jgi:hypothetical protein
MSLYDDYDAAKSNRQIYSIPQKGNNRGCWQIQWSWVTHIGFVGWAVYLLREIPPNYR